MPGKELVPLDPRIVNQLAKKYNVLAYFYQLVSSLKELYPGESFDHYSKYHLHRMLSDILCTYHAGEAIHKFNLFKQFQTKSNLVGAFEMRVDKSRVDFLTINGRTTSFEIKSALDNLSKLDKQMSDYAKAFELNYLVVDERHLSGVIKLPACFGLWSYAKGSYKELKRAKLNSSIDPEFQLHLLTKAERMSYFSEPSASITKIIRSYSAPEINSQFKRALKGRYQNRWQFVKDHQQSILPIDLQFFFNMNIQPSTIYG